MHPPKRSLRDYLRFFLTGFCMGSADIVPGVSGGTMAFILGIYEQLIDSIRAVGRAPFWRALLGARFTQAMQTIDLPFLAAVAIGILTAILTLAKGLEFLLEEHPRYIWSFFFGLVLASVFIVASRIRIWNSLRIGSLILATLAAYFLVGLVPVETPDAPWFLVLSGAIAICAMILPGISGSFLLVLLGKYEFILQAVNQRDLAPLGYVGLGAGVGIVLFAQLLSWLLHRWHDVTIVVLTGFMLGSLRRIWPWKESLQDDISGDIVEQNVLPAILQGGALQMQTVVLIGIMIFGMIAVWGLERVASRNRRAS